MVDAAGCLGNCSALSLTALRRIWTRRIRSCSLDVGFKSSDGDDSRGPSWPEDLPSWACQLQWQLHQKLHRQLQWKLQKKLEEGLQMGGSDGRWPGGDIELMKSGVLGPKGMMTGITICCRGGNDGDAWAVTPSPILPANPFGLCCPPLAKPFCSVFVFMDRTPISCM